MTPISAEEWYRQLANAVPPTEEELADAVDRPHQAVRGLRERRAHSIGFR